MSASTGVLWRILREPNPVAIVYYPESATREDLLEQVALMAPPERKILRARDVDDVFRDPDAIVLLTPDDEAGAVENHADGRDGRGHPAVTLTRLEHVEDGALLTVSIEVERDRLKSYSVSIVGRRRAGDTTLPFYARIDLDDSPKGHGLCGHPLLHCHVGADPEDRFSPRSPLPWIHPADALDWLLSTVHPGLEPRST